MDFYLEMRERECVFNNNKVSWGLMFLNTSKIIYYKPCTYANKILFHKLIALFKKATEFPIFKQY